MSDILERGSVWLDGQRVRHLSRPVTYARGESSARVQAAAGKTDPIEHRGGQRPGEYDERPPEDQPVAARLTATEDLQGFSRHNPAPDSPEKASQVP